MFYLKVQIVPAIFYYWENKIFCLLYKMNNQEPIRRKHMNANIMKIQSINLVVTFMLKNTIFIIKKETRGNFQQKDCKKAVS